MLRRLTLLATIATSTTAVADQVVVFDETWTHSLDVAEDSHYYQPNPLAATPSNWASPINYADGSVHLRLEVRTKPTDAPTVFQVCFEGVGSTYACTGQSPAYTRPTTVEWDSNLDSFWSPPGTTPDWSNFRGRIVAILKDTENRNGGEDPSQYMPTTVRLTVTAVSAGATYQATQPMMDAGVADAGSMPMDAGVRDSGVVTSDAGTVDAGVRDAAVLDSGTAGGTDSSLPPATSDSGTSTAAAGSNLGCSAHPNHSWGLVAIAALWTRRRVRRQRHL